MTSPSSRNEPPRVAVGRGEGQQAPGALRDGDPADLDVTGGAAGEVLGRAAQAQHLLDNDWACLIPRYVLANDVAAGRMRAVPIRDAALSEGIGLYHRATKYFSPLQQAAVDALRAFPDQVRTRTGSAPGDAASSRRGSEAWSLPAGSPDTPSWRACPVP